jgi:Phasin protein
MTMQNEFIKPWIELNKLAIDSFKKIASNNVTTTNQMLTSFVDPSGAAELTQSYIALFKDIGQVYTDSVNDLFRTQVEVMNLQTTSETYKNFWDIYLSSMKDLGQKQAELMQLYVDTTSSYWNKLNDAKKVDDLGNVSSAVLTEFQDKAKKNMEDTLGVLNALSQGMDVWTTKSLDAIAEGNKSSS